MSLKKADLYIKKAKLEIYKSFKSTEVSNAAVKHLKMAEFELPGFEDNQEKYSWKVKELNQVFEEEEEG